MNENELVEQFRKAVKSLSLWNNTDKNSYFESKVKFFIDSNENNKIRMVFKVEES